MTASDPLGFLPPFESTSKLVALEIDVYESINVEWMVERGSGPVDLVAYRVIDPTGRIDEGTVIASKSCHAMFEVVKGLTMMIRVATL